MLVVFDFTRVFDHTRTVDMYNYTFSFFESICSYALVLMLAGS